MKKTLLIAALALSTQAFADPIVGIDIASWHDQPGFNNSNPGVYAMLPNVNGSGPAAGTYYNSLKRQTYWAGYVFGKRVGNISYDLLLGGATGYNGYDVVPMAVPSVAYNFGHNAVRIHYIADIVDKVNVLHLSVEHSF